MKHESIIWKINLFKKNGKEAICLVCQKTLKRSGGSSTGLIRHLEYKHADSEYFKIFLEMQKKKDGELSVLFTNFKNSPQSNIIPRIIRDGIIREFRNPDPVRSPVLYSCGNLRA
jgi:hypothetical protein